MPPTLSVVMANYNHGKFVQRALEAIIGFKPLEIIVVDDCSTDDSVQVIERFGRDHANFSLVRNESNQGVISSFNKVLAMAAGDYVYPAGADDLVLPGFFQKSMDLFARYPQAGICSALVRIIDEKGREHGLTKSPKISHTPAYFAPEEVRSVLERRGLFVNGNSCIYRRSAVEEFGYYDHRLESFHDGFLAHAIAAKHGACFIPEPLACWRKMDTGFSQSLQDDVRSAMRVTNYASGLMRSSYQDLFSETFIREFERRAAYSAGLTVSRRLRANPAQVAEQMRFLLADQPVFMGSFFLLLFRLTGSFWLLKRFLQAAYLASPAFMVEKVRSWREDRQGSWS